MSEANCSAIGCDLPVDSLGLCVAHYTRKVRGKTYQCKICGAELPIGRKTVCSDACKHESAKANSRKNALRYHRINRAMCNAKHRNYLLKSKFGIDSRIYKSMSVAQNGLCAICGKACSTGRRLAVDHDHASNSVRGLLCTNCNQGIWKFFDKPELLRAAAEYLDLHATAGHGLIGA